MGMGARGRGVGLELLDLSPPLRIAKALRVIQDIHDRRVDEFRNILSLGLDFLAKLVAQRKCELKNAVLNGFWNCLKRMERYVLPSSV
jgi:hypothetical protein